MNNYIEKNIKQIKDKNKQLEQQLLDNGYNEKVSVGRLVEDKEKVELARQELESMLGDFKEELYVPSVNDIQNYRINILPDK